MTKTPPLERLKTMRQIVATATSSYSLKQVALALDGAEFDGLPLREALLSDIERKRKELTHLHRATKRYG